MDFVSTAHTVQPDCVSFAVSNSGSCGVSRTGQQTTMQPGCSAAASRTCSFHTLWRALSFRVRSNFSIVSQQPTSQSPSSGKMPMTAG